MRRRCCRAQRQGPADITYRTRGCCSVSASAARSAAVLRGVVEHATTVITASNTRFEDETCTHDLKQVMSRKHFIARRSILTMGPHGLNALP